MRAFPLLLCSTVALAQGRFTGAGELAEGRWAHTATLLEDGRVLVVGGRGTDSLSALTSAELFDPRTKRWTAAAPLSVGRALHTATLLDDGRVLVCGGVAFQSRDGRNAFLAIASAELYDAKANRWTAVAPLAEARSGHTATRLSDGRVLVVGGAREGRGPLASVELFDPQALAWSPRRPLALGRTGHEAVRLSDGSVVVLGGRAAAAQGPAAGTTTDTAERFDASAGTWHRVPDLNEPRLRTAVVALGDTVTVLGGQTATTMTNYVESWSPGAEGWSLATVHLSMPVTGHTATALAAGDVLVVGGEPPNEVDTARAQRWEAKPGRWCLAGELVASRKLHTATPLAGGKVLIAGGTSGGLPERAAELWEATRGACVDPPGLAVSEEP